MPPTPTEFQWPLASLHPEGPENLSQDRAERHLACLAMAVVTGFGILFLMLKLKRRWQSEGARLRSGGMLQAAPAIVKPPKDLHMTGIFSCYSRYSVAG
jgi:hypothetical protein